jgi:hypothetical protein
VAIIYNGILLSHKKNEILSFAGKWIELENITLSSEGQKPHFLPHTNAAIL